MAAALAVTSCSSGDDAGTDASTVPTTQAPITNEECIQASRDAVGPLQAFVDRYDSLSVEEWNALDPPPDVEAAQTEVVSIAQAAVDRGCDPTGMEQRLAEAIETIEGRGEVGRSIAAALRGDGPLFGPPEVVIPTTAPRDQVPTTVTLQPGESLSVLLARVAPGSTVKFAAGTHRFTEPVLVEFDVHFVGAGEEETILSSTAEGVAVAFVGPGGFSMRDLTLEHRGDKEASVLLAIEGPVAIENATIRGGVVGGEGEEAGGGHGIVFAYENLEGFPERSESERRGRLTIRSSTVTGNDAAGVLVTGTAAPAIVETSITGNGSCGVCYTGTAAGTLTDGTIESNSIGVQIGDETRPVLTGNRVRRNAGLGISVSGGATPTISASVVEENGDIGIQILDNADVVVENNTVRLQGIGLLVGGTAHATITGNGVVEHELGIQAGVEAVVDVIDNAVWLTSIAAISYGESSSGTIRDNRIDQATGVAIQSVGSSNTDVIRNRIENLGTIGISFAEQSSGSAIGNEITGREVGIQVDGTALPDLVENVVRDSVSVGILYGGGSGGSASKNVVGSAGAVGIVVGGISSPTMVDNDVRENAVGMVFRESNRAIASRNTIELNGIGVQITERSRAIVEANMITNSLEAGAVFAGSASGRFESNTLATNGNTAMQVGENAHTRIAFNEIRGGGIQGVIFQGTADSEFRGNRIINFVFGMQVNESAAPQIYDNTLEEVALTNIAYSDDSGGEISGNTCTTGTLGAGISIAPPADPNVGDNDCTVSRG